MTILLADAGATKTDWVKLSRNEDQEWREETYTGVGISPLHHDTEAIEEELRMVRANLGDDFDSIRFFGTGIGNDVFRNMMATVLSEIFRSTDIIADSDLAGAAFALLGNFPGIVCIMGTGSSSCHFDGEGIDRKVPSLGYILDDEGGGFGFCSSLLADIFKGVAPPDIVSDFQAEFNLDVKDVTTHLYREPAPNRWVASFMPFIISHLGHPYISELIRRRLDNFFSREFSLYPREILEVEGIGFTGSVASLLSSEVKKAMTERGWRLRNIYSRPMDGLKEYVKHQYSKKASK